MNFETRKVELRVLTPTPGHLITSFKEGDPIETYHGANIVYLGSEDSAEEYREITEEEHAHYEKLKEEHHEKSIL